VKLHPNRLEIRDPSEYIDAIAKFAEDARRKVPRTTFSTSSALQRSRFGEIGNPEG